jgi:RNA polymerase sigma-70 factor (ECF subfamily)
LLRSAKEKANDFLEQLQPLQRLLEGYCRRMLRDRSQVEDVLQSAVLQAFAQFDSFAAGTNFKAWIFRFTTGAIFNLNRKHSPVLVGDWLEAAMPDAGPEPSAPDDMLDALLQEPEIVFDLLEEELVDALQQLTPPERAVFLLRSLGELSYKEIRDLLSIPLGSVIGYLSRARSKLRAALLEYAKRRGLLPSSPAPGEPP